MIISFKPHSEQVVNAYLDSIMNFNVVVQLDELVVQFADYLVITI